MGSPRVSPDQKRKFAARLLDGWSIKDCCDFAGVSYAWGKAYAKGLQNSSGRAYRGEAEQAHDGKPGPIPRERLRPEALRALDDFGFFRFRYLGRLSTPWQEEAGHKVVEWLSTPRKEYVVENAPPGSGKSTLHTLDIPLWLTCRRRSIRGMLGSASQTLAEAYLFRLKNHLEMVVPVRAEDDERELGLAVDAQATLVEDFGRFREPGAPWSSQKLVVAQFDDRLLSQKEATWTAWGLDTSFIGGRYDVSFWDDAVEEKHCLTAEAVDRHRNRWDKVAEKRPEPGGLLLLQGQRLAPSDLYKYCSEKKAGQSDLREHAGCCDAEDGRKYHLVRFKAHDELRCHGDHGSDAKYWPDGCLLDPRRLPWVELEAEMENSLGNYMQVYQQEDGDPSLLLVNPLWVRGGTDPATGEVFVGCWDDDRGEGEWPDGMHRAMSIASTDPSPTKYWANGWWAVETAEPHRRFLLDLHRKRMTLDEFLERRNGRWVGLAEEWWQASNELGHPITHWIWEENVAQRFFLQTQVAKDWSQQRGVTWVKHQTTHNRTDPKYGPQRVSTVYRQGLVRFPGSQVGMGRVKSLKLITEAQSWPKGQYDDCLMMQTFVELKLKSLLSTVIRRRVRQDPDRPSWLREAPGARRLPRVPSEVR